MEYRRLLRPLPLILIFIFVSVAVADLVQKLTEEPPPPPEIAGSAIPRFEVLEPVIDFRANGGEPSVEILPIPEFEEGQWSEPESQGFWAKGSAADLKLEFATGGHRVLILECLPASGKNPVRKLTPDDQRSRLLLHRSCAGVAAISACPPGGSRSFRVQPRRSPFS